MLHGRNSHSASPGEGGSGPKSDHYGSMRGRGGGWWMGLAVRRNEEWSLLQKNFKSPLGSCAFVQMSLQFSVQFVL